MKKTIVLILTAIMAFSATSVAADFTVSSAQIFKQNKKKGEIKEVKFNVHLHCNNCVKKVQENIAFEKGVKDLNVSLADQTVTIKYDASKTSEQALKAAIESLGYKVQ